MAMSEKQKEWDKTYQSKIKQYRVKYTLSDLWIADIIDKELLRLDQSYNEYSRRLVIDDLLKKGLITMEELQRHGMDYPKNYLCKKKKLKDVQF